MSPKPVIPRDLATADVNDAATYYVKENATQAALTFANAVEDAYTLLSTHPAVGSARYAVELGIPELRSWARPRFPYVIFYVEREDHIDVWRVLHARRDIPAVLEPPEQSAEPSPPS